MENGATLLLSMAGAKAVDGIDIQEEMVELAKQATSDLDMVHIQVEMLLVVIYLMMMLHLM